MYLLPELLGAVLSFDIAWFISLVFNNLFWVFAYSLVVFVFFNGKHLVKGAIALAVIMWGWSDFQNVTGLFWNVGGFMLIYYISKLAVIGFAENTRFFEDNLVLVSEAHFIGLIIFYNFFMVGA